MARILFKVETLLVPAMEFSEILRVNVVPEWTDSYLAYNVLKTQVYLLKGNVVDQTVSRKQAQAAFQASLDLEIEKIASFYFVVSENVFESYYCLVLCLKSELDVESAVADSAEELGELDEKLVTKIATSDTKITCDRVHQHSSLVTSANDSTLEQERTNITMKKSILKAFVELAELRSYIELNKIGVSKISKKFDSQLGTNIRLAVLENLENNTTVFDTQTSESINDKIDQLYHYASILLNQTIEEVANEFSVYFRQQIIMERSTLLTSESHFQKQNAKHLKFSVRGHEMKIPRAVVGVKCCLIYVCIIITFVLLFVKTMKDPVQGRALALLVCFAFLWATEAIPLFATSILIPFMVVVCKVLKNDDGLLMDGPAASQYILSQMFSSVIMLLLGGFALAAALTKYRIAKILSSYVLYASGTKPRNVLLSMMGILMFLSMWILNIAAPVLCYSLISPILNSIPTELPIATALVLGIAYAANVGGMASPIASPQNIVAMDAMSPLIGWGKWFAIGIPVSVLSLVGIWLMLIMIFSFKGQHMKKITPIKEPFNRTQWFICVVTVATIILWCILTKVGNVFGESGIIACLPMVLLFGLNILDHRDLNEFPWHIVVLAQGGLALGKAITSSGLLRTVTMALRDHIEGWCIFQIFIVFGIIVLIFLTFVSHTVAALVVIPLVKDVGDSLPHPQPLVLIMGTALVASAAMALPTSGFPNVTAIGLADKKQVRYIKHSTFIALGIPASIITFVFIISLGYGIMIGVRL